MLHLTRTYNPNRTHILPKTWSNSIFNKSFVWDWFNIRELEKLSQLNKQTYQALTGRDPLTRVSLCKINFTYLAVIFLKIVKYDISPTLYIDYNQLTFDQLFWMSTVLINPYLKIQAFLHNCPKVALIKDDDYVWIDFKYFALSGRTKFIFNIWKEVMLPLNF